MLHDARCNMEICCPGVKISQDGETLHFRRQTNSWIMIEVKATVLFWRYLQDSNVLDIVCFRLTYHHGQNIMHNYTHNNTTREWTDICYETLNILLKYSAQITVSVDCASFFCSVLSYTNVARCPMQHGNMLPSVYYTFLFRCISAHLIHRRPQAWARGGTCPPPLLWKCCKVILCISSYSKTLSRRIIYAVFSQPVVSFWGLDPKRESIPGPHWGTFVPRSLICPPLEKSCGRPWLDPL